MFGWYLVRICYKNNVYHNIFLKYQVDKFIKKVIVFFIRYTVVDFINKIIVLTNYSKNYVNSTEGRYKCEQSMIVPHGWFSNCVNMICLSLYNCIWRYNIKVLNLQRERDRSLFSIRILYLMVIARDICRPTKRLCIDENVAFNLTIRSSIRSIYSFIEEVQQSSFQFSFQFRSLSGYIHALILVEMKLHYKVKKICFF